MRNPIEHELKCEYDYFIEVENGNKNFELRIDDRDVQKGDILHINQLVKSPTNSITIFTGKTVSKYVTYVLRDAERFGLMKNYCIISMRDL